MKQITVLCLLFIIISCKNLNKEQDNFDTERPMVEKKYFSEFHKKLDYYNLKAKEEFESGREKQGLKYLKDSVKTAIVGSYIDNYRFEKIDGTIFEVSESDKPIFLQVTATWCPPCKAEIPALNTIVEKYADSIDFVLLFRDTKEDLKEFALEYDKRVNVIPSPRKLERGLVEISGFRHKLGFPYDYLISKERFIQDFKGGAFAPDDKRTIEDVYKLNYEKLESEILNLLKSGANKTPYEMP